MATIIAVPILTALLMVQTAIASRILLLRGTADLILLAVTAWALQKRVKTAWQWGIIAGLLVSFVSALPVGLPLAIYLLVVGIALLFRQRVWQVPVLAMLMATFISTWLTHAFSWLALRLIGNPIGLGEALNLITLPSVLLNILLAVPFYGLFSDLAKWLYPEGLEG